MAGSSPTRRQSYQWSSPQQSAVSDILYEDRNSEARHRLLLETAKREHERVRAEAERVYREHVQKEERQRLLEEERREEERIRLEQQIASERLRLQALKAKKVSIPPPEPEPEPEPEPTPPRQPSAPSQPTPAAGTSATSSLFSASSASRGSPHQPQRPTFVDGPSPQKPVPALSTNQTQSSGLFGGAKSSSPFGAGPPVSNSPSTQPLSKPQSTGAVGSPFSQTPPQTNGNAASQRAAPTSAAPQGEDRYVTVHKNLKELRKVLDQQTGSNRALKGRMGDMRREIRKAVGQLTSGVGANRTQIQKLNGLLKEALANTVQSQPIDPSAFVLEPREPVAGAAHNETHLPSLFLYLLNIFAKAAINQFINEGGAKPDTADPIGIVVADVFSAPEFLWRGKSLIDVLLAKYRVSCPVLFGYRGSEKTEQGRRNLGWKREGGAWMGEQQHMDRMTGLGAGFAAVSLRNFGKSKKTNPYPPRNYWTAMARIVNTPAAEISNTQGVVLKAMIQHYERKFLDAYGTAAVAALELALVQFPARAPEKSAAINSLQVLAQMLRRDTGLLAA